MPNEHPADSVPPIEPAPAIAPPVPVIPLAPPVGAMPPPPRVDPYAPATPYAAAAPYSPAPQYARATPNGYAPQSGVPYYPQAQFNVLAIVGFVLAFFVCLGAVICGHIALSQIRRTGERGHGLALAAVIIGYVGSGFWLLYFVVIIIFVLAAVSTVGQ